MSSAPQIPRTHPVVVLLRRRPATQDAYRLLWGPPPKFAVQYTTMLTGVVAVRGVDALEFHFGKSPVIVPWRRLPLRIVAWTRRDPGKGVWDEPTEREVRRLLDEVRR